MSVKFAVYEGSATLEDLGTLASIVGKKGSLAFIPKNLLSTKRVAIVGKNVKGESTVITCSTGVSDSIRGALKAGNKRNAVLAVISKLHVLEGDSGVPYICAPAGEGAGLEEYTIESLAKVDELSYEEMVEF